MNRNSITGGGLKARSEHWFKIITLLLLTKGSESSYCLQTLKNISVDVRAEMGR